MQSILSAHYFMLYSVFPETDRTISIKCAVMHNAFKGGPAGVIFYQNCMLVSPDTTKNVPEGQKRAIFTSQTALAVWVKLLL